MSTLLGWASTNSIAAFFAAASRLGATSVADMLFDTSIAMTTVPAARDTGTERRRTGHRHREDRRRRRC